ncbi:acetyltransferase [Novosphingobium sediminis]|uniref:Acetyltransferase n=1 Tax=Novosphingobium sediminis TaxID=707214 RepID=A0A512AMI8_9SPHN|nr:acyltransferase [Novosphingobium sediminis]GEO00923.1 acetyltransferase [Novosphingobium sediminis]
MGGHERYRLLDELRGVAAVAVLVFHIGTRGGGPMLLPNGFLAVDFFFMLSGFVIAEAYEARLQSGMTFGGFAARRLVRMAPVAMLGALAGGAYLVARAFAAPARSDPLFEVVGANLLNLLILPKLWQGRATGWELFPANGPLWSLFFEIAINLIWAAFLAGRSTRLLCLLVAVSAGFLVSLGLHFGTLHIGWEAVSLAGGAARVGFGFGIGLLLHRVRAGIPLMGHSSAVMALATLVYFLILPLPLLGWQLLIVLVCMPAVLLVAIAAGQEKVLPGGALLGRLSYPLYGTHVPLLALTAGALKYAGGVAGNHWTVLLLVPFLLAAAWAVLVWFDEPARVWLARFIPIRTDSRAFVPAPRSVRRLQRAGAAQRVMRRQLLRN